MQMKTAVLALLLVGLFINILQLTGSLYMLQVYDRVLASQNEATLLALTILAIGLVAIYAILEGCRTAALIGIGRVIDRVVASRVFDALFRATALNKGGVGVQPLRDLEQIRNFVATHGITSTLDVPWIPVFVGILYILHPAFGVFGLVCVALFAALAVTQALLATRRLRQASNTNVQAYAFAEASVRNAEVTEAMGMRSGVWRRWQERHLAMLGQQEQASRVAGGFAASLKFLQLALTGVLGLGLGALLVLEQQITPGAMIVATMLLGRAVAPTTQVVGLWQQMTAALASHRRLCDFLDTIPAEMERMPLPPPKGELTVEGLVLGRPGQALIIRGVSFALEPGESLAVIGPSAAGKSTLARGLLGIWPPLSGSARLDGADISRIQRVQIGPHIGYLPQDVELFEGTISENIARLGEVDPELVVRSAEEAGLHNLILHLPEGYDTVLGPAGAGLSPGQRQRIGLARALYGSPRLVILDEPNSNLDTEGEAALSRALAVLREKRVTCVVITHRASVLAAVDKILILRAGQAEAFGRREEILPRLIRSAQQPAARAITSVSSLG
jgi:ATP-binding cassette, subfamily C, bacterial EexD